jgi:transcriptional regulator with XRE-family HTH domain
MSSSLGDKVPNKGIGKRIAIARMARGISQSKLAEMCGVHPATIGRIESELIKSIELSLLEEIATRLSEVAGQPKVSVDDLRNDLGEATNDPAETSRAVEAAARPPFLDTYHTKTREGMIGSVLSAFYPNEYGTELRSATHLWVTGTNLRRIVTDNYLGHVRQILERGGSVKVLMNHPLDEACRFAMIQDRGPGSDLRLYKEHVHHNLSKFCEIRETGRNGKNLEIRTINYPLSFGLDILNGENETAGVIYVRFYPLPNMQVPSEDRPIVKLRAVDGYWYDFFKDQFERHWADKAHRGLAENLLNYSWRSALASISKP